MYNLWVLYYFFQKSLSAENYFLITAINFTTRGLLYTYLVVAWITPFLKIIEFEKII